MKRCSKATLKTVVWGRRGKSVLRTPLTVRQSPSKKKCRLAEGRAIDVEIVKHHQSEPVCETLNEKVHVNQRKVSNTSNWEKIREAMLRVRISNDDFEEGTSTCVVCGDSLATIRCQYCGPKQYFCHICAENIHADRNQFHVLEQWKNDHFIPLFPDHGVVNNYGHRCSSTVLKTFKLVDAYGNQHLKQVAVCNCESDALTLVRCNFWPGTPERPTVAFHFKLMDLAVALFLHSQVPLKQFVEVMSELTNPLQPCLVSSLYNILNSGCFEEYRFHKHNLRYLNLYSPDFYTGNECPLCPQDEGILIESLDACFGLPRKKARGGNDITGRHGNEIFSDQNDVDNYIENYNQVQKNATVVQECSQFHAGEVLPALRSKGRNKLFDEKGVFGRVCRHDFPKSLLNIKHGERISYSVYELKKLKESIEGKPIQVVLMYDIACILSTHLKNNHADDLVENVTLAVPIFHCYGHKASCQVKFNPRRTAGAGLSDGEGVERFWSFLRQFSSVTKEMATDKRTDVLTDATFHYREHLLERFGTILKEKKERTAALLCTVDGQLAELLSGLPDVSEEKVREWAREEEEAMNPNEQVLELLWDEEYVHTLNERKRLQNELEYERTNGSCSVTSLETKLNRLRKVITRMEKEHGVRYTWQQDDLCFLNAQQRLGIKKRNEVLIKLQKLASERIFLLELKAKYADGQAIAIKLSNQINRLVIQMKRFLTSLNGMTDDDLKFDDIKNPQGEIYQPPNSQSTTSAVPLTIQKKLVNLQYLSDRCKEELSMIASEMKRYVDFLQKEIKKIYYISTVGDSGLKSLLNQKAAIYKKKLFLLQNLWQDSVEIDVINEKTYSTFNSLLTVEESIPTELDVTTCLTWENELEEIYEAEELI